MKQRFCLSFRIQTIMRCFSLFFVVLATDLSLCAANIFVTAPAGSGTQEGNTSLSPLHAGTNRFQQVYSASLFSALPPEGGLIRQIIFRTDITGNEFQTTLPNIRVDLSTTPMAPDGLNEVFSANVGPDVTTIIGPGELFLRGFWGPNPPGEPFPSPQSWSIVFDLPNNPFYYNPQAGNLLLDIWNFAGSTTSPFDAVAVFGDTVSSVVTAIQTPLIPEAGSRTTAGLATYFVVIPIPEPSGALLFLTGLASLALLRYWKGKKHVSH